MNPPRLSEEEVELYTQVAKEVLRSHGQADLFTQLSPEDMQKVLMLVRGHMDEIDPELAEELEEQIYDKDFERRPVSPEEFIANPFYLGEDLSKNLYDTWKKEIPYVMNSGAVEWLLTGSIGCGKCVVEGSLIPTTNGVKRIEDIQEGELVLSESGPRRVVQKHDEGVTETRTLVTKHKYQITGRPNHRVRILGEDFNPAWKELGDFKGGECVLLSPSDVWGTNSLPDELAELIGWYTAEGSRQEGTPGAALNSARFDVHEDEQEYVFNLASKVASLVEGEASKGKPSTRDRARIVRLWTKQAAEYFPSEESRTKTVPRIILQSDRRTVCAYLRGLFSGDGHSSHLRTQFCTTSPELARQVRVLLTYLGIQTATCESVASIYGKQTGPKYQISIIGTDSQRKFAEQIGFALPDKQAALMDRITKWQPNSDKYCSFRLTETQWKTLRDMQPLGKEGQTKTKSPRGLMHRLKTQRCTVRLLRQVLEAGGVLPGVLADLVSGRLLCDYAESVKSGEAHCFDLTVEGDPSYISEGFISHNTTAATAALMYKLYVLTCMRNPCSFYGSKAIVFGFFSITRDLAQDVEAALVVEKLKDSEYFRKFVGLTEEKDNPRTPRALVLRFPKNLKFVFGSQPQHVLGQDTFGCLIDEAAFERTPNSKQIRRLYSGVRARLDSRFMSSGGRMPGLLVIASSANYEGDFMDDHLKNSVSKDRVHISSYALYHVKKFPGAKFRVLIGDKTHTSQILDVVTKDEYGNYTVTPKPNVFVHPDARVEEVPAVWYQKYEDDLEQNLKDISGITLFATSPLFGNREKIYECIDKNRKHPFTVLEPQVSIWDDTTTLESLFIKDEMFEMLDNYRKIWRLKVNPGAPRFFHVDLAKTGDAAGLTCVHLYGFRAIERPDREGKTQRVQIPVIYVDFALRIRPTKGSEIDFTKITSFIFYLQTLGMPVGGVSADSYQSTYTLQVFKKAGVEEVKEISMDRTPTAYLTLKEAILSGCVLYYDYPTLQNELTFLQYDRTKNKIDHPINGSKDVSDSLAGAHFLCTMSKYTEMQLRDAELVTKQNFKKPPTERAISQDTSWIRGDYEDWDRITDIFNYGKW